MVLKSGKFGVNSGNTLKNTKPKLRRQYLKQGGIIRNQYGGSKDQVDPFEYLDLNCDGVFYSLNKKKRWAMADYMCLRIFDELVGHETQVTMVELDKLNKSANAHAVFVNKGDGLEWYSQRGTYINSDFVLSGSHKKGRRSNRRRKSTTETPISKEGALGETGITYQVLSPAPADSSVTFNPKYMKTYIAGSGRHGSDGVSRKGKRSRAGRRFTKEMCDDADMGPLDDLDSIYGDEYSPADAYDSGIYGTLSTQTTLQQFIDRDVKNENTKRCNENVEGHKSWSSINTDKKCKIVYIEHDKEKQTTCDTKSIHNGAISKRSEVSKPAQLRIIIPNILVKPEHLQSRYGRQYREANCKPRRFFIEITNLVYEELNRSFLLSGKADRFDLNSFVLFSFDGVSDNGLDIFNVSLQMDTDQSFLKLHNMEELKDYSVDEVLTQAVHSICRISPEQFKSNPKMGTGLSCIAMISGYENLKKVIGWKTESFLPPQIESDILETSCKNTIYNNMDWYSSAFRGEDSECCSVCLESIDPFLLDSATSTCLQSCGHWFCDDCWREYLVTRIKSGFINITCPDSKCDAQIDMAILMTFIPLRFVRMHLGSVINFKTQSSRGVKWCPNAGCGRVVRIEKKGRSNSDCVIIECACGLEFCFGCQNMPHWPAPCNSLSNYMKNMLRCGDENIIPFYSETSPIEIAQVKQCPNCGGRVEKAGGCNFVRCTCASTFCWACLKPEQIHTGNCRRMGDNKNTQRVTFIGDRVFAFEDNIIQSTFYQKAVEWRSQRIPHRAWKIKKLGRGLSRNLARVRTKSQDYTKEHGRDNLHRPTIEVNCGSACIETIVKFICESSYILEFTAVLMDNATTVNKTLRRTFNNFESLILAMTTILSDTSPTRPHGQLLRLISLQKQAIQALIKLVELVHVSDDGAAPLEEGFN